VARIAGVDLPREKRLEVALTYIYGIGQPSAKKILAEAKVSPEARVKDMTEEEVARVRSVLEVKYTVEGDLKREISTNIKRLMDIGTYRGLRHRRSLPVRGQRTSTNARTRKGPRRTVGAKRKSSSKS
jgi:small subunit ribosomal protein S13